jgi:hypothetical protein
MFDSTSVKAAELLSYFGRNTAIEIDHRYGSNVCAVISTRTKNIIAEVDFDTLAPEIGHSLEAMAISIMAMKKFPKNRKMNRTWSPIRLTARAEADREITRATLAWSAE